MWRAAQWMILTVMGTVALAPPASSATLKGRVEGGDSTARRAVQRYQGAPSDRTQTIKPIPTIVFIKGAVAGAAPKNANSTFSIEQKDTLFSPSHLVVPVGASVGFPNEDDEFHNVFSYSKTKRFDLGRYRKGESKSVRFDREGVVKIYCEIHSWMRAVVVVVSSPFFSEVDEGGNFTIENIPPGTYTLVAWNIDRGSEEIEIQVARGQVIETEIELSGLFNSAVNERFASLVKSEIGDVGTRSAATGGCCDARSAAVDQASPDV